MKIKFDDKKVKEALEALRNPLVEINNATLAPHVDDNLYAIMGELQKEFNKFLRQQGSIYQVLCQMAKDSISILVQIDAGGTKFSPKTPVTLKQKDLGPNPGFFKFLTKAVINKFHEYDIPLSTSNVIVGTSNPFMKDYVMVTLK